MRPPEGALPGEARGPAGGWGGGSALRARASGLSPHFRLRFRFSGSRSSEAGCLPNRDDRPPPRKNALPSAAVTAAVTGTRDPAPGRPQSLSPLPHLPASSPGPQVRTTAGFHAPRGPPALGRDGEADVPGASEREAALSGALMARGPGLGASLGSPSKPGEGGPRPLGSPSKPGGRGASPFGVPLRRGLPSFGTSEVCRSTAADPADR